MTRSVRVCLLCAAVILMLCVGFGSWSYWQKHADSHTREVQLPYDHAYFPRQARESSPGMPPGLMDPYTILLNQFGMVSIQDNPIGTVDSCELGIAFEELVRANERWNHAVVKVYADHRGSAEDVVHLCHMIHGYNIQPYLVLDVEDTPVWTWQAFRWRLSLVHVNGWKQVVFPHAFDLQELIPLRSFSERPEPFSKYVVWDDATQTATHNGNLHSGFEALMTILNLDQETGNEVTFGLDPQPAPLADPFRPVPASEIETVLVNLSDEMSYGDLVKILTKFPYWVPTAVVSPP